MTENITNMIVEPCDVKFILLFKKAESYADAFQSIKDNNPERKDIIIEIVKEAIEVFNEIKNYDTSNLSEELQDSVTILMSMIDLTKVVYDKVLEKLEKEIE